MLALGSVSQDVGITQAIIYLQMKGYEIIFSNYRSSMGTIDIGAVKDDVLVFVDVAITDKENGFDIDPTLRNPRSLREKLAVEFIGSRYKDCVIRFDCIDIMIIDECRILIRHTINALDRMEQGDI